MVEPRKDISRGRWLGGFTLRFDFYTNGLVMTPDDNVSPELAEAITDGVVKVMRKEFRITSNVPRLNPFKTRRVTSGCTTDVYGLFYNEVWQKEWGVFHSLKAIKTFLRKNKEEFERRNLDPDLFRIVSGIIRFS